jgi:predicted trehalose synthase
VPRLVGWVEGEWTAPDGSTASGHLTSVSEFLGGSEDAWRIACIAVQENRSFDDEAYGIGAATALVHRALAETLPTFPTTPEVLAGIADHLQQRVEWAASAAPGVKPYVEAASRVAAAVRGLDSAPDRQRVHGDFHLGQVLHAGDRGWVILDFEGEPLRPLVERNEPDLAVRDIAGMMRSFDYAARHNVIGVPEDDPRSVFAAGWARSCQQAFLAGYASVTGQDPSRDGVLQRSFELDKALYEVVYESRHRPDWVDLPLHAVDRLLSVT